MTYIVYKSSQSQNQVDSIHVIGGKKNEQRLNIKYAKKEIIHNPGDSGIIGTSISCMPVLKKGERGAPTMGPQIHAAV